MRRGRLLGCPWIALMLRATAAAFAEPPNLAGTWNGALDLVAGRIEAHGSSR
jgi:hypothetical protein